jgi:hypothetical protein
MWKNVVERGRPQITRRMRIACWIPKATNTHTCCVILIAFSPQQSLHERASMLRYTSTYFTCFVIHHSYSVDYEDIDVFLVLSTGL